MCILAIEALYLLTSELVIVIDEFMCFLLILGLTYPLVWFVVNFFILNGIVYFLVYFLCPLDFCLSSINVIKICISLLVL